MINCKDIIRIDQFQTASQKIWKFIIDASKENNGLFYIHILYESHYSYPSPYVSEPILAEGTAMLFDYLDKKGGKLRADYIMQQKEALHYLDDLLDPLLTLLDCRMVIYSYHGKLLLDKNTKLMEIRDTCFSTGEELIRIPLVIFSPEMNVEKNNNLFSLMNLNSIICSLMRKEKYSAIETDFIKIGRSEIYNPDFKYLYNKKGVEQELYAFEGFLFEAGYKLIVYSNKVTKLYNLNDEKIENDNLKKDLLEKVNQLITCSQM